MTNETLSTNTGPRLHLAVCLVRSEEDAEVVAEQTFDASTDVRLGGTTRDALLVPGWTGPPVLLISADGFLHLRPGMRVNMCGDHGASRVVGSFEELLASGIPIPIPILRRRMNIRIGEGVSIFAKYVDDRGRAVSSQVEPA